MRRFPCYRYDATARKRYKTVEIVVSESDWSPPLRIGIKDTVAQEQVKAMGGRWNRLKWSDNLLKTCFERFTILKAPPLVGDAYFMKEVKKNSKR